MVSLSLYSRSVTVPSVYIGDPLESSKHQNKYDYYCVYLTDEENRVSGGYWLTQGHTAVILIQKFSELEQ